MLKGPESVPLPLTPAKYGNHRLYSLRGKRDWCGDSIMEIQDEWDEWTERPCGWALS
jgi:hypothetical protein